MNLSLVDGGLRSGCRVRPTRWIQLVVGNRAAVLLRSVGGQVLCSHTGGVLDGEREEKKKRKEQEKGIMVDKVKPSLNRCTSRTTAEPRYLHTPLKKKSFYSYWHKIRLNASYFY